MSDEIPVACCLSDSELRIREATLFAQFKAAVIESAELDWLLVPRSRGYQIDRPRYRIDHGGAGVLSILEI